MHGSTLHLDLAACLPGTLSSTAHRTAGLASPGQQGMRHACSPEQDRTGVRREGKACAAWDDTAAASTTHSKHSRIDAALRQGARHDGRAKPMQGAHLRSRTQVTTRPQCGAAARLRRSVLGSGGGGCGVHAAAVRHVGAQDMQWRAAACTPTPASPACPSRTLCRSRWKR